MLLAPGELAEARGGAVREADFVERRESAWVIWSRAVPLLGVFYVLVGLNALDLRHWSVGHNVAVAVAVAAVLGGVGIGANVVRVDIVWASYESRVARY